MSDRICAVVRGRGSHDCDTFALYDADGVLRWAAERMIPDMPSDYRPFGCTAICHRVLGERHGTLDRFNRLVWPERVALADLDERWDQASTLFADYG